MLKYEKLSKVRYKLDESYYKKELEKRMNGYGSYLTPLKVLGFKRGSITSESFKLFYVNIHQLMSLNNCVIKNSSKITELINKLPEFVTEPYFNKLIINEAQSNNEIEGIRSTKKELSDALVDLKKNKSKNKRFSGLMKAYEYIDQIKPFENIEDFRELYDKLVADEIGEGSAPDGKYFRKNYVEINDGINTTHIGMISEDKIIESLGELIKYLQDSTHPELYRYMVAHYYYEYIHPFYDGNGRTGRLIVGSYLSRYLEKYSAITFSYAVNKNKAKYYSALEQITSPLNQGEMTFYLISVLELLSEGQMGIIEDLEIRLMKLETINQYFREKKWWDSQIEVILLRSMIILNVFIEDTMTFTIKNLQRLSKQSRYIVEKSMENLLTKEYVVITKNRPKTYKIGDRFLEEILLS